MPHYNSFDGGLRFAGAPGPSFSFLNLDAYFGIPLLERGFLPGLAGIGQPFLDLATLSFISPEFIEQFDVELEWLQLQGSPQFIQRSPGVPLAHCQFVQNDSLGIATQTSQLFVQTQITQLMLCSIEPVGPTQQVIYCIYDFFPIVRLIWDRVAGQLQMIVLDETQTPIPSTPWNVPTGIHVFRWTFNTDSGGTDIELYINGSVCPPPFHINPPIQSYDSAGPQLIIGSDDPSVPGTYVGNVYASLQYSTVLSAPEIARAEGRLLEMRERLL
jgi:hypothetical protein